MKLLILSDSHGNIENMIQAVSDVQPDHILHLGDLVRDGEKLHARFPDLPFDQVPGNCDHVDGPQEKILSLEGHRILLCHGHTYHVKSGLLNAMYGAQENQADIFLFGHTHRIFSETRNGVAMLNPGSIGDHIYPTYGIVTLSGHEIHLQTLPLRGYPSR